MKAEEKIILFLKKNKQTLSVTESCTGGLVSNRLTNIPGASECFEAGIIAYSNQAKSQIIKVSNPTLKKHGAVSEQTAIEMAQGVRELFQTDFGISLTGIAGPSGGTKKKPVGLTFIAISTESETLCLKCVFEGTRTQIKSKAATQALKLLLEFLE